MSIKRGVAATALALALALAVAVGSSGYGADGPADRTELAGGSWS